MPADGPLGPLSVEAVAQKAYEFRKRNHPALPRWEDLIPFARTDYTEITTAVFTALAEGCDVEGLDAAFRAAWDEAKSKDWSDGEARIAGIRSVAIRLRAKDAVAAALAPAAPPARGRRRGRAMEAAAAAGAPAASIPVVLGRPASGDDVWDQPPPGWR